MSNISPTFDRSSILENTHRAQTEISRYLMPTPLVHNAWISDKLGCQVYLKLESMQPIGSFKIRGAAYRLSRLPSAARPNGVIAGSAGNHAQGVAWAAKKHGISAQIIMP
ncbi:MAG: pyridoxal-phosphate dependent enzyme, partial [Bdellovibrionota bacterium]